MYTKRHSHLDVNKKLSFVYFRDVGHWYHQIIYRSRALRISCRSSSAMNRIQLQNSNTNYSKLPLNFNDDSNI